MSHPTYLVPAVRAATTLGFIGLASAGATVQGAEIEAPEYFQLAQNEVAQLGRTHKASGLEEIVVTARRRDENAQDVPIAISVVSGDTLAATGGYTLNDVQRLAPSLQIYSTNPRNTNINIRGLGANIAAANDGLESGVGVYVDNVYYARPGQSQFDLIDIQQIEVLRGPQGTLFGKNTTAGAINVTTKAPSFEPEATVEASLGELGFQQVRASVTGPVIDDLLAYRVTLGHTSRDGLVDNVYNGSDGNDYQNLSARGQLLYTPSDTVEVRLIGDYSRFDSTSTAWGLIGTFNTYDNGAPIANNFNDRLARLGYTPVSLDPFDRKVDLNGELSSDMESYGVSAQVDWDLDRVKLTSISAYRWWDWYPRNDIDYTHLDVQSYAHTENFQRQFSQEIRLASQGDNFVDYVAGAYYLWQRNVGKQTLAWGSDAAAWLVPAVNSVVGNTALDGFTSGGRSDPEISSYAVFGQLVWHLSDKWELTTGLRYTYEEKEGSWRQWHAAGADLSGLTAQEQATALALRNSFTPVNSFSTEFNDDAISGLVSLSYAINDDVLAYATYSNGAKSGGMNLSTLPDGVSPLVQPESVDSYELGLKSQWLDGRITLNSALFHTTIDDYQTSISDVSNAGVFRQYISNAAKARSEGFEVESRFEFNDNIALTAAASYTDAHYVSYKGAPSKPENANEVRIQDLSGEQLAGIPKVTWNVGLETFHPLKGALSGFDLYSNLNYAYRDDVSTAVHNSRYAIIDGYGLLNGRVGIRNEAETWDLSLWARNLADEKYFQAHGPQNYGLITGLVGEPRIIGAALRVNF